MTYQKQLLIGAVIHQIKLDVASDDTLELEDLLGNLNEDVMLGFVPRDISEEIYPEDIYPGD